MTPTTGRAVLLAAVTAGAVCSATAACSARECAGALQRSAVSIDLPRHLLPETGTFVVRACAGKECHHDTYNVTPSGASPAVPPNQVGVGMSPLPHDADVAVSVRITAGNRTLFRGTARAHTVKPQLYDPPCGFDHWQIHLTAHRNGRLT